MSKQLFLNQNEFSHSPSLGAKILRLALPPCIECSRIFWGGKGRGRCERIYSVVTISSILGTCSLETKFSSTDIKCLLKC